MSEMQVYEIAKNLWNNQKKIAVSHSKGKEMNIENVITAVGNVPIYPGALRFYKEVGIIVE